MINALSLGAANDLVGQAHCVLSGRILLWDEIKARLATIGLKKEEIIIDILGVLAQQRSAFRYQGVSIDQEGRQVCNRCGQSSAIVQVECQECTEGCFQCEECIAMGASRTCTPLWAFPRQDINTNMLPSPRVESIQTQPIRAQLSFALTSAQRDAAERVLKTIASSGNDHILIWAACGAGKTEVSFAAIAYILRQGGKVLFAIPRRDVVLDLEPRLKKAFPEVPMLALYGGCEQRYAQGDLVLATTHQVLRFYQNFDLVVLDEVDAFPYKDSAMLHFAIERARKPGGKLILMTATPEDKLLREYGEQGKIGITIPARHHGHPLPEPELIVSKRMRLPAEEQIELPPAILALIFASVVDAQCRLFIFVPRISLARRVAEYLRMILNTKTTLKIDGSQHLWNMLNKENRQLDRLIAGYNQKWGQFQDQGIQHVYARDPERDEKVQAFKEGQFPILVTTSIMERGVTISRCNVMVLGANTEHIFGAGTLIQMAGRAGRTSDYPTGKVWFVGNTSSPAMKIAVQRIRELNLEAREKGYLDDKQAK